MTKDEIDIQKEIEKYFTESTGFGKDKIRNFMDIVNKALKQKGERIEELENKIADIKANCDLAIEGRDIKIKELEKGCDETQELLDKQIEATYKLDKKNAGLEKENENLKARLNAINLLTPELKKLSKDKDNKLAQAKEHIKLLLDCLKQDTNDPQTNYYVCQYMDKAEQFLKEIEK